MGNVVGLSKSKLERIIDKFEIKSLSDAVYKMKNILNHEYQIDSEKTDFFRIKPKKVVDKVCDRMNNNEYEPPIVGCPQFAYLMKEFGNYFGHDVEIVAACPDYLRDSGHFLVYDNTDKYFLDPSITNRAFDGENTREDVENFMDIAELGLKHYLSPRREKKFKDTEKYGPEARFDGVVVRNVDPQYWYDYCNIYNPEKTTRE